jgi:putative nucleotidyltransferase with HDIG domain
LSGFGFSSLVGFAALVGMAVMSEALAVRLGLGQSAGSTSVTFIPLLASVQLFGVGAAVILITISVTFAEFVVQRKTMERGLFNVAQLIIAACLAGWAFHVLGGTALDAMPGAGARLGRDQLLPFLAFGLVFLAANHAAVSFAIALSQELQFSEVWTQILGRSGVASLQDLLISPIAIAVAFLYLQMGPLGVLVVFFPLLFIRHAYLDASRLREANSALLKALIKAIETRDPYTSGHSLRVAHLARRIAESLCLPRAVVDRIERAALLHDVGKIEAPYSPLLSKPSGLTPEERAVIESHVVTGEELLRNLSSFPEEVLRIVRHHHEREDGNGYPDGLDGDQIPLGAQIVAVCDAVDAMLSDRPYRPALSLEAVLGQLHEHSGTQFSQKVVDVLLESHLIFEYADLMRASRRHGAAPLLFAARTKSEPEAPVVGAFAVQAGRRLRRASGALWPL